MMALEDMAVNKVKVADLIGVLNNIGISAVLYLSNRLKDIYIII